MARLIDADALKKHYAWWEDDRQKLFDSIVDQQPTVDAVPVVRCKNCINRYSTCPMITVFPDGTVSFRTQDDWFCFMGERKEE